MGEKANSRPRRRGEFLLAALSGLIVSGAVSAADYQFNDVRVFTGTRMIESVDVRTHGDRVVAVGHLGAPPPGTVAIDGTGKTLLPGLIDAHAHPLVLNHLREAILFGVTTELGMFDAPELTTYQLCAGSAPDRADLFGAVYPATPPGGHGTEYGIPVPTLTQPSEAADFVAARVAEGAHHLKIIVDDLALFQPSIVPALTPATVRALVRSAHRAGLVTTAHVTKLDDARDVILAGVDGLAHMPLDELPNNAFALLALATHTFIAPTIAVFVGADGGGLGTPPQDDPRLSEWLTFGAYGTLDAPFPPDFSLRWDAATGIAATGFLHDRGVTLLAGTDAANPTTAHGASMHHEMELLVYAGLSPLQALEAATALPARAFRLHDRGRIAPGKLADLLLVEGNPAVDILATRNIEAIWKGGVQVNRPGVYLLANQPPALPPACP